MVSEYHVVALRFWNWGNIFFPVELHVLSGLIYLYWKKPHIPSFREKVGSAVLVEKVELAAPHQIRNPDMKSKRCTPLAQCEYPTVQVHEWDSGNWMMEFVLTVKSDSSRGQGGTEFR